MVKCADCGFLAVRNIETRELDSPDHQYRSTGTIPVSLLKHNRQLYEERPVCIRKSPDFPYNPDEDSPDTPRREAIVQTEHGCVLWGEWQPVLTPKEHRELLDRQWVIDREERSDKEMRAREDRRDAEVRRLQERLHNRELWIIGGLATIALVGGSIAAAIIEGAVSRGFEPSWWPF